MADLTSGVNILPDMIGNQRDIVSLFNGIARSKAQQKAAEDAADAEKYKPFYKMMDEISLKDVDGKDLPVIMGKYNELGSQWTKTMAATNGKPEWQQMMDLQKQKDEVMGLITKHTKFKEDFKTAYVDNVIKGDSSKIDKKAVAENLDAIAQLPLAERYNALQEGKWFVEKTKPFSIAAEFNTNKELEPQKTTDVNGNYRFDAKAQEANAREAWKRPSVQERAEATGITEDEYVQQAVEYGRSQVQDKVKTKESTSSSSSTTTTPKIETVPTTSFRTSGKDASGNIQEFSLENGHTVKAKTQGDFVQLDSGVLMGQDKGKNKSLTDEWGQPLVGQQKVLVNEASVGYVPRNNGKTITVNGRTYTHGEKIEKRDVDAVKKNGGSLTYSLMINTIAGKNSVEIWASKLSEEQAKEFGIPSRSEMPNLLTEKDYNKKFGKVEEAAPAVNKYSQYKR